MSRRSGRPKAWAPWPEEFFPEAMPAAEESNLSRVHARVRLLRRSAERLSYWERNDYLEMLLTTWERALELDRRARASSPQRWLELEDHLRRVEASIAHRRPVR